MAMTTKQFPDGTGNVYVEYSGEYDNIVRITADANESEEERELTLTFRIPNNGVTVERRVVQAGMPAQSYVFDMSLITSSSENTGVQIGWKNGSSTVNNTFSLNGDSYNSGTSAATYYANNSSTNHVYNITADKAVGNMYDLYINPYANVNNITDVNISGNMPRLNFSSAFHNCYNLANITSTVFNVTNLFNAFGHCWCLTNADFLSNWRIDNITTLYGVFYNCPNLTSLDVIADWNVAKVTNMVFAFYNCHNLHTHGFNNWTGMSANCANMFMRCNALDDIQIHWNITYAANMFANRNTPLNVYASTSTNAYNQIYKAMGNSTNNTSWNVTLYAL